jgi:hypothetical protein
VRPYADDGNFLFRESCAWSALVMIVDTQFAVIYQVEDPAALESALVERGCRLQ